MVTALSYILTKLQITTTSVCNSYLNKLQSKVNAIKFREKQAIGNYYKFKHSYKSQIQKQTNYRVKIQYLKHS